MAQHLQRGSCTPGINNLSITFSVSPVEKYMGYFKFILSLKDKSSQIFNTYILEMQIDNALTRMTPIEYRVLELFLEQTQVSRPEKIMNALP